MFTHKTTRMILLVYVDDILMFDESDETIDQAINELHGKFELTEEKVDQDQRQGNYKGSASVETR